MAHANTHSPRHQIRGWKTQLGVHLLEDDNGETETVAVIYLENWHDNDGWLRIVANVPRLRHKPNYNNGSADDSAGKHTRNPSTDRDDVQDVVQHLDAIVILGNAEQWAQGSGDSRTVKSRCVASTSRRGVFFTPHIDPSCDQPLSSYTDTSAAISTSQKTPTTPPFWTNQRPRPTPNHDKLVERGRFDQPDRSDSPAWTHPVIANGKLYVRDQGLLLCYDLKP